MMSKEQLVEYVRALLPSVKLIYLFGSQASGNANHSSDIDVAVLSDGHIDAIERFDIEQTLAIKAKQDVDLVDLLAASTVMQNQVIQNGELIYGDESDQYAFEMQVLSMYQRLNQERADILQGYIK